MKEYKIGAYGTEYRIRLYTDTYRENGNFYAGMENYDEEDDKWEPYDDLTTNIGIKTEPWCGFIKRVSPGETNYQQWLIDNKIAEPTGRTGTSGFNFYDEYRFDPEALM